MEAVADFATTTAHLFAVLFLAGASGKLLERKEYEAGALYFLTAFVMGAFLAAP